MLAQCFWFIYFGCLKILINPKFVIEREIPNAGKLSVADLKAISQKSCGVIGNFAPSIQWVESFVTEDKIYCIYLTPNKALLKEHAKQGDFPANRIEEVSNVISAVTTTYTFNGIY